MKKYVFAAALVIASTSALADRVENGSTRVYTQNRAKACENAKYEAADKRDATREQVAGYGPCDCAQDKDGAWKCSVDVRLEKRE